MRFKTLQTATLSLLVATGLAMTVPSAHAGDDITIVHIKAIDGLHKPGAKVSETRDQKFFAGSRYNVSRSVLPSLDGVKTLVLVERRADAADGDKLTQTHTSEVLAVPGDTFSLQGLDGKNITYAVDRMSDGSADLLGPGSRIVARAGGVFKIWKVESVNTVSRSRVSIY